MMKNKSVLLKGNEAIAKGAIDAGLEAYFGYPITPQSELIEYMASEMKKKKRIFIQAESEISAINMLMGAASAGACAMTSSSSPGISLKQEGISYIAGCELPAVIVNIMRGGPGLGNIAPAQSDYFQATKGGGHGDYHNIVLAPYCVEEMYSMMFLAFELAFKWRNPVIVAADGVMGQMMENVDISSQSKEIRKGNINWRVGNEKNKKQVILKSLYLDPYELEKRNLNLVRKYQRMKKDEQRASMYRMTDAQIAIVAFGLSARIAKGIIEKLRKKGLRIGLIRPVTLWPFPERTIMRQINKIKELWVIELNAGQMVDDVRLAGKGKLPVRLFSKLGGVIPKQDEILDFFTNKKATSNLDGI